MADPAPCTQTPQGLRSVSMYILNMYYYVVLTIVCSIIIIIISSSSSSSSSSTVGVHNFNLRIFNLRVSNPNKSIVDVF